MKEEQIAESFLSERLNYPVNVPPVEKHLFHPFLQWHVKIPRINSHYFLFVYQNGMSATVKFKPVLDLDPLDEYHSLVNRSFFVGKLLKALKSGDFRFSFRPVFYCLNDYSDNYFHWFTEVLPKMIYAQQKNRNSLFFIPFTLRKYQTLSLELFKIKYKMATHAVTCLYRVHTIEKFTAMGCYHAGLLATIRTRLLESINQIEKTKRIYITRRNASRRTIVNEAEVCAVMQKQGFEIVDFDGLDFHSQVAISRDASVMVSLHGAALTNMIFMKPRSVVLEFVPRNEQNDKCYFTLAGTMNLKYYYLACDIDGPSYVFSNYYVDTALLDLVIASILSTNVQQ